MLKERVQADIEYSQTYQALVRPLPSMEGTRDVEFYVRYDGLILNADGYAHPQHTVVGNVLYAPDSEGNKEIFGIPYRKTSLVPKTFTPVPYRERGAYFANIDPALNQTSTNSYPFRYEQILPREQFIGYIPAQHAYELAVEGKLGNPDRLLSDLENLFELLGFEQSTVRLGLTGTPALGHIQQYHDLDIVFFGTIEENRLLANRMRDLVLQEPERRLHEGGKSWQIRFYNRDGITNGTIMCCFFGYKNIEDCALPSFEMNMFIEDVCIQGVVSNADHALYTPTVVNLHNSHIIEIEGKKNNFRLPDDMPLIVYHTGTRGELNVGDEVWAHGAFGEIITDDERYLAVVVNEREGVRNETAPWSEYYTIDRI
jgi:predicted nucleotidyltransferase